MMTNLTDRLAAEISQRFIEILPDAALGRMHASGELKALSNGLALGDLLIITVLPTNDIAVRVQLSLK